MAVNCPNCGYQAEDGMKFCPVCGSPVSAEGSKAADTQIDPTPAPIRGEIENKRRHFIPRDRKYGDTGSYDDLREYRDAPVEAPTRAANSSLSLYLSVVSLVLSVTTIVLLVIFVIMPAGQRTDAPDPVTSTAATLAPTQPPTDPPIAGSYSLWQIDGEQSGLYMLMIRNSRLEMRGDYTGSVTAGGMTVGQLTLDKEAGTAVFLNTVCPYSFDGSMLSINYHGMTLVYKKDHS